MKKVIFFLLLTSLYGETFARNREDVSPRPTSRPSSIQGRAGDCIPGKAQADLDINNIRAKLLNTGDMWWDRSSAKYGAPKLTQDQIQQGMQQTNALFSGAIWISGKASGNMKMASILFSQGGSAQFWPGPIHNVGGNLSIDKSTCSKFDKFWTVTSVDIANYQAGKGMSDAIKYWPGKGNSFLINQGTYTAEDLSETLAPFYDVNGNGIYEPTAAGDGDFPTVKYSSPTNNVPKAYADQMVFWVTNDIGNGHTLPDALPIGLQMNCLAFAYQSSDELNNMTFYTYKIINKSNDVLEETYMSQYADCDLGNFDDDYVGCDTTRDLGYCVNANAFDADVTGAKGYGLNVPILGIDFFEGPKNPLTGKNIGMSSFSYFRRNPQSSFADPTTSTQYRSIQEGKLKDGANMTEGGDCSKGTIPTKFCFPGNPALPNEWSMCSSNQTKQDIRFIQNSGPFNMGVGDSVTISVGVIFVQPPIGSYSGCQIDVNKHLFGADEKAQRLFDFGFIATKGPDAPSVNIIEDKNVLHVELTNLETSNNYGEGYNKPDLSIPTKNTMDSTYKFQGYQIFQVLDPSISSTQLGDNTKAKLVKQMDLVDNIKGDITNYSIRIINGDTFKTIDYSTKLENTGILNNFTISEDLFQQEGTSKLVNNKPYYFAFRTMAYNDFFDTVSKRKQSSKLKFSDNLRVISAIPHDPMMNGVKLNAAYNQNIPVKRITGVGHGNLFLNIPSDMEKLIVDNGQIDELQYSADGSPIKVQVTDPYTVRNAKFKLKVFDSTTGDNTIFNRQKSYWTLDINDNGTTYNINSQSNLERTFNQTINAQINNKLESFGITVGLSSADSLSQVVRSKAPYYRFIGASLIYGDTTNKWLNFFKDKDNTDYYDWIRSGSIPSTEYKYASSYNFINNKVRFNDSTGEFNKILDGIIAPYCLTANNSIVNANQNLNYASNGPGFKWNRVYKDTSSRWEEGPESNLDSIFSVELVITPDNNKWTQCVVLETGESSQLNEFEARKGQIRKAVSLDKDLTTPLPDNDSGRSWFPGYAINLETGIRVNVYFGENSRSRGQGAANMIWDPNSTEVTTLKSPVIGGGHYVYVTNTKYDNGKTDQTTLLANFNKTSGTGPSEILNREVANVYRTFAWTTIPIASPTVGFYDKNGKYQIPSEVRFKVRVQKPYGFYLDGGSRTSEYTFSTEGLAPSKDKSMVQKAFEDMRCVPNPYNAYSVYEGGTLQNRVKFVNVPVNSKITIFTTDGILVRKIQLDGDPNQLDLSGADQGAGQVNTDNTYSWDMRTSSGVMVASGVYYINVEAPNVGTKVMKLFVTMRAADVSNF